MRGGEDVPGDGHGRDRAGLTTGPRASVTAATKSAASPRAHLAWWSRTGRMTGRPCSSGSTRTSSPDRMNMDGGSFQARSAATASAVISGSCRSLAWIWTRARFSLPAVSPRSLSRDGRVGVVEPAVGVLGGRLPLPFGPFRSRPRRLVGDDGRGALASAGEVAPVGDEGGDVDGPPLAHGGRDGSAELHLDIGRRVPGAGPRRRHAITGDPGGGVAGGRARRCMGPMPLSAAARTPLYPLPLWLGGEPGRGRRCCQACRPRPGLLSSSRRGTPRTWPRGSRPSRQPRPSPPGEA